MEAQQMAELYLLIEINKVKAWGMYQIYPTTDRRDIQEKLERQHNPEKWMVLQTNSDFEYLFIDGEHWLANYEPPEEVEW